MLPIVPKPPLTSRQKAAALVVAGVVDLIQIGGFVVFSPGLLSPAQDLLDVITVVVLIAICGFKWQFVLAFGLELMPIVPVFPTWTAFVLSLPTASSAPAQPINVTVSVPTAREESPATSDVVDVDAVVVPPVQPSRLPDVGSH